MNFCILWITKYLTIRNLITSLCSLLTVFLICQILFNYIVERPTSTSMEEKVLRSPDIPETVICADPGFDSDVLEKYGYTLMYYRGSMNGQDFVGWNGRENESNSADAILKEALLGKPSRGKSDVFLNIVQTGGVGSTHVQKFCRKLSFVLEVI